MLSLLVVACSLPAGSSRINSSHFVYPNSNVTPIGQPGNAEGSKSKLCGFLFFMWNGFAPEVTEKAYIRVLEKSGGDILINANESRSTFLIPSLFATCTTSVKGTAAKMQMGAQELR